MQGKVIGIRKSENPETKVVSTNIFVAIPFSQWESENSLECSGEKIAVEFIRKDINAKPGDIVNLEYEKGFQDKAVCSEVTVLKRKIDEQVPKK